MFGGLFSFGHSDEGLFPVPVSSVSCPRPPTGSFSEGGEVHHHPRLLPGRDAAKQAQGDEPLRAETGHVGAVSAVFAVAVVTAARPDSQGRDERCLRNLFQIFLVVVLIKRLGFITFRDGSKSGLQCSPRAWGRTAASTAVLSVNRARRMRRISELETVRLSERSNGIRANRRLRWGSALRNDTITGGEGPDVRC